MAINQWGLGKHHWEGWGGISKCLMIYLLSDISHNYMPVFILIPKHKRLHNATKCFGLTWNSIFSVLNSNYDFDFVDNFSIPAIVSIRDHLGL